MEEPPSLLNQGTYGCVYKPAFSCNPSISSKISKKMVSKITIDKSSITQEIDIGKNIQNIPQYDTYFAPILNSCHINLGEIKNEELQTCQFIQDEIEKQKKTHNSSPPSYKSNIIRYVGTKNIYETTYRSSFPKILSTHIHLLKALTFLQKSVDDPIIHFDLKDNNIIFDEIYSVPIIIDFGISFPVSKLKTINKDVFYIYYEKYPPWCIEIVILSYIIHKLDRQNTITIQDISGLKSVCSVFVKENPVFENGFDPNELLEFENTLGLFIDSFISKSWDDIISSIISNKLSWDNYSLSVIYHDILIKWSSYYDPNSVEFKQIQPYIVVYTKIIKDIILSPPTESRQLPNETQILFEELSKMK
jgi:serine/threonine protein kinase